jgi:hypothetical protein
MFTTLQSVGWIEIASCFCDKFHHISEISSNLDGGTGAGQLESTGGAAIFAEGRRAGYIDDRASTFARGISVDMDYENIMSTAFSGISKTKTHECIPKRY